jgi:hypothetical protein
MANHRLSPNQRNVQRLVTARKVNDTADQFIPVKIAEFA